MARRRIRTTRRVSKDRKRIWLSGFDSTGVFAADANGRAVDDAVLFSPADWAVVNISANEKATLLRIIIWEFTQMSGAATVTRPINETRVVRVADEDELSPTVTLFAATFLDQEDVTYSDCVPIFQSDAYPNRTDIRSAGAMDLRVIDSRIKRKLKADDGARLTRWWDSGQNTDDAVFGAYFMYRALIQIS